MEITKVWGKRFHECQATGRDEFTYAELAKMFGIAQANVAQKFKEINELNDGAITEVPQDEEVRYKVFKLHYDILLSESDEPEPEPEFPEWMVRTTYDALIERLNLDSKHSPKFEVMDWEQKYQRGGVRVLIYENGQKFHDEERVFRLDNCVIVN